jgi:prepilin-type N-terminal cleavage/methylation domain-containing protein
MHLAVEKYTMSIKTRFTLIELLLVVAIIGILVTLLMPSLTKARNKARIAVCLSNQRQMSQGTQYYLKDNKERYPFAKFSGADGNTGRHWVGKKGTAGSYSVKVTQRPLNKYLNYTVDGMEVPIASCPMEGDNFRRYNSFGSVYMAAARTNYSDDLDSNSRSLFLSEVNQPTKMVLIGETTGWHYANNPDNKWKAGGQFHYPGKPIYSFSFIDGHVKDVQLHGGMGISADHETLNFRNF